MSSTERSRCRPNCGGRGRLRVGIVEEQRAGLRGQRAEQLLVVLQLAARLRGLVLAQRAQVGGQAVFDGLHGVDATGAAVEPDVAQRGVGRRRGGAAAAQALELGQHGVGLAVAPQREHRVAGEFREDLKAALLRFDEVQPLLALPTRRCGPWTQRRRHRRRAPGRRAPCPA
jgi:hypothetical protein